MLSKSGRPLAGTPGEKVIEKNRRPQKRNTQTGRVGRKIQNRRPCLAFLPCHQKNARKDGAYAGRPPRAKSKTRKKRAAYAPGAFTGMEAFFIIEEFKKIKNNVEPQNNYDNSRRKINPG